MKRDLTKHKKKFQFYNKKQNFFTTLNSLLGNN